MRTTPCLLLLATALVGCDPGGPPVPLRDAGMDASSPDAASPGDAGASDSGDSSAAQCERDSDCAAGLLCFGGGCQPDPCEDGDPCTTGERCRARCVATVDPCRGVVCGADETCIDGDSFPGCLPVACEGVSCPSGQFCDPARGRCAEISPCDARCGDGAACHFTCTPRSACEGVTCPEGQFCRAGACIVNPCAGVTCARGEVCNNGLCIATCGCEPECTAPDRCIGGTCTCVRSCPADATCGAPDGCGGFCMGPCSDPGEECNPDTGLCECVPSCEAGAACGAPDGCGGLCDGACGLGQSCVGGVCECLGVCLGASEVACGAAIPDTCAGGEPCPGRGTRCETGATCLEGACCPACPAPTTVACGEAISEVTDTLGRVCRSCTGVGSRCATGTSCTVPPGTTAPTDRVCCAPCAAASTVACGTEIPDVLDDDGNVCRECSGYGTAGCMPGTTCTGGAGGMCCGSCSAPAAVDCGEPIPASDCRTCTGYGNRCSAGLSCANPPGTTGPETRECCASCPAASSVACGMPIPDPAGPSGAPCRDCGTGTMCPAGSDCVGGSCCPRCPSSSSVACGVDIPDQRDASGAICRMCSSGTMCSAGSTCSGGACCGACAAPSTLACGVDPMEAPGCPACPTGTRCDAGERCTGGACCAPTCAPPSTRPCGERPSDGCGGTCSAGTGCPSPSDVCMGSRCVCSPSCVGRRCGESDGCGGECPGTCDPGFACSERPPPAAPGDYQCEASTCVPSCGLCQSCVAGSCEPLVCAPGQTACLLSCQCCASDQACTPEGCQSVS
ncbi:MAG: hypothetical protein ACK5U8_23680 [Deltaproteobacteria bacterium]